MCARTLFKLRRPLNYAHWLSLQAALVSRARHKNAVFVVVTEHTPTYTVGRRGADTADVIRDSPVYRTTRGGEAVYHGPGQIGCYVIGKIRTLYPFNHGAMLQAHVSALQTVMLEAARMQSVTVHAGNDPGFGTGVFNARNEKVGFVGFGVETTDRVTTHGCALNANISLDAFSVIDVCGRSDAPVANIGADSSLCADAIARAAMRVWAIDRFGEIAY